MNFVKRYDEGKGLVNEGMMRERKKERMRDLLCYSVWLCRRSAKLVNEVQRMKNK